MKFIWILNYKKMIKTNSQCFSISETLAVLLICCKTLLPPQGLSHQNVPFIHRQPAWTDQTYQIPCMKTYRQCCHVCMLSPTQLASPHPGKSDSFIPSIPPAVSFCWQILHSCFYVWFLYNFIHSYINMNPLSAELLILLLTFLYNLSY